MVKAVLRLFIFVILVSGEAAGQFAGGAGTLEYPYQISTIEQLQEIKNHPNNHFILINNIDAVSTSNWNDGAGFEPIGENTSRFTGSLNGNGFQISNLHIERVSEDYVGLFGYADGAVVENLKITNAVIHGSDNTGILLGFSINGDISNVQIQGTVSGQTHVGGLVGFNYGEVKKSTVNGVVSGRSYIGGLVGFNRHVIIESSSSGEVHGTGNGIGGLVGNNYDGFINRSYSEVNVLGTNATSFGGLVGSNGGKIQKSYAHGEVTGRSYVGGLIGFNRGDITESYSTGNVHGNKNGVGGLIGNNFQGEILQTYAKGNVTGATQVGGLIGVNRKQGEIKESFAAGEVTGGTDTGGLIGLNENVVLQSFWDQQKSAQKLAVGRGPAEGITGLTTSNMRGVLAEENMAGLTFNKIWGSMPDDYPQLLWEIPYFYVDQVQASEMVVSGQLFNMEFLVRNVGGQSDTSKVTFKDSEGNILSTSQELLLAANDGVNLMFNWQSSEQDVGEYEFTLETPHYQRKVKVNVRLIPSKVEVETPDNLAEHVDLTPIFEWDKAALAESYQLQIAEDNKFEHLLVDAKNIDTTFYKLPNSLNYLSNYFWRVRAANSAETGEWSKVFSFQTIVEKPELVTLYEPEKDVGVTSTYPNMVWSTAERAEDYYLQLSKEDDFEELVFDTTFSSPDTTFKFKTELPADVELFWRVQASNAGGDSDWSEVKSFITKKVHEEDNYLPMSFTLKQNYPNPFNSSTNIQYGIPTTSQVRLEVLNMLGQSVALLVNERKSPGWHTVTFNASELSSGFYLYRIKANEFESTKKLMLIK